MILTYGARLEQDVTKLSSAIIFIYNLVVVLVAVLDKVGNSVTITGKRISNLTSLNDRASDISWAVRSPSFNS